MTGGRPREPSPSDGPLLMLRGGGGGGKRYNFTYWVWPLPPEGKLTFLCEWRTRGLGRHRTKSTPQPTGEQALQARASGATARRSVRWVAALGDVPTFPTFLISVVGEVLLRRLVTSVAQPAYRPSRFHPLSELVGWLGSGR